VGHVPPRSLGTLRVDRSGRAASSFFLGVAVFELGAADRDRPGARTLFLTGALFGLAFEFRFPVGLMVAGWFLWAGLVRGRPARELIAVGLGVASAVVAAAPIDRWGYGDWSFPPLNFVIENMRGGRAEARFGSMPQG